MAIYIPRRTRFSCTFKRLLISPHSASSSDALHNDYGKLAYENVPGNIAVKHTSLTCECKHAKSRSLASMTEFTDAKPLRLTSAMNITQTASLTSAESRSHMKLGLFRNMINHIRMQSMNTEASTRCRSCGKYKSEKGFLICPSCNAIQALNPTMSYFQIFALDEKFELDVKDLEAKYKSLMKKLHPDLSHGKSMEDKENSAQLSALVTTAYNELLKPVSRATYMLKLRDIDVEDEGTVTDSELIMEVMEIRETLQNSPDRKTLEKLHKTAATRMDEWSEAFKSALKEGDDIKAVGALQRMSYFGRVCDDISRELL